VTDTAGNGVRITQREVYDQLLLTDRKVDLLVDRDTKSDAIHEDFERRLRRMETLAWKALGALTLVAFFFSAFGYFIAQGVLHHP
jgi:hypothetical protein